MSSTTADPKPSPAWSDVLELLAAVSRMRVAQRDYFKHRSPEQLQAAKDLEAQVDRLLLELASDQPRLF